MKTIVLGPPGTGKTTTLLNKVDDYLKETDQLTNHLEEFCLNRHIGSDVTDLKKGGVWTNGGYHHFVFSMFYSKFLVRQRWEINYQRTAQMLKDHCNCDDKKRVGKERISVFTVKQFDKKKEDYVQKELKPKDVF